MALLYYITNSKQAMRMIELQNPAENTFFTRSIFKYKDLYNASDPMGEKKAAQIERLEKRGGNPTELFQSLISKLCKEKSETGRYKDYIKALMLNTRTNLSARIEEREVLDMLFQKWRRTQKDEDRKVLEDLISLYISVTPDITPLSVGNHFSKALASVLSIVAIRVFQGVFRGPLAFVTLYPALQTATLGVSMLAGYFVSGTLFDYLVRSIDKVTINKNALVGSYVNALPFPYFGVRVKDVVLTVKTVEEDSFKSTYDARMFMLHKYMRLENMTIEGNTIMRFAKSVSVFFCKRAIEKQYNSMRLPGSTSILSAEWDSVLKNITAATLNKAYIDELKADIEHDTRLQDFIIDLYDYSDKGIIYLNIEQMANLKRLVEHALSCAPEKMAVADLILPHNELKITPQIVIDNTHPIATFASILKADDDLIKLNNDAIIGIFNEHSKSLKRQHEQISDALSAPNRNIKHIASLFLENALGGAAQDYLRNPSIVEQNQLQKVEEARQIAEQTRRTIEQVQAQAEQPLLQAMSKSSDTAKILVSGFANIIRNKDSILADPEAHADNIIQNHKVACNTEIGSNLKIDKRFKDFCILYNTAKDVIEDHKKLDDNWIDSFTDAIKTKIRNWDMPLSGGWSYFNAAIIGTGIYACAYTFFNMPLYVGSVVLYSYPACRNFTEDARYLKNSFVSTIQSFMGNPAAEEINA